MDNTENKIDTVECDNCTQVFFINTLIKVYDNSMLCDNCIKEYYLKCVECNDYHPKDDCIDNDGETYCSSCDSDQFCTCEDCNEKTHIDNIHSIADKIICQECYDTNYDTCDGCTESFNNDDLSSPEDSTSRQYCSECLCENTTCCDNCGAYFLHVTENSDGDYYCSDCYDENSDTKQGNINSASFVLTNGIKRRFGVEIECFCPENEIPVKSNVFDKVDDGSLDNLDDFIGEERRSGKLNGDDGIKAIQSFCKELVNTGYIVNKSSGLHCHVDMSDLSDKEIANILSFCKLYDNMLFHLMPRSRRGNNYCDYVDFTKHMLKAIADGNTGISTFSSGCRYKGTNIQAYFKHKTLEFRYHSGTIDGNKITAWVNLCLAIVEIGKTRFWAESKFIHQGRVGITGIKRMLSLLNQTQEQKDYWIMRFKKFNNMPVVLATEGSEV